jgi:subtilisin-like proprotein convertase family protein
MEASDNSKDVPYVPTSANIHVGDINFNQTASDSNPTFNGRNLFAQNVSSGYTFSLENNPSQLQVNASTGELSLNMANASAGLYEGIVLNASNGTTIKKTFSVALNGDPLRKHAWHIENTGQKTFATFATDSGFDLNLSTVFEKNITGDGVRIAVSDSGVEINHDDLHENALDGEHRDYSLSSPYIGDPVPTSSHGTAVTGIINAVGWNNMGSIGVAPGAKFAGFQFLNSLQSTSLLINQASGNFDIFNFSYGDAIFQDTISDSDYIDHLRNQTISSNKVYVKAAGNEYLLGEGTTCAPHNANFPFENESPFVIVVGAVAGASTNPANKTAIKSSYSNPGSNIWVSAPGGEYGKDDPAILTTDLPTCFKGYSKATSGLFNLFEYGHSLNSQCHYTSTMNGTSSAAPMVSGVIALLREANPSLKMRDIKHILANTSKKINPNHEDNYFGKSHPSNAIAGCSSTNLTGHVYEQGWVTNDAGYEFNNFYGFGMVDADAAVTMAESYTFGLGTQVEQNSNFSSGSFGSGTLNTTIPDNSKDGRTDTIAISAGNALTVESVQIKVKASHAKSGQLGVELTSPQNTKSILMNINNSFLLLDSDNDGNIDGDSNLNIVLTSNAFYGEDSEGVWTIKLIDGKAGTAGTLTEWHINILGHN